MKQIPLIFKTDSYKTGHFEQMNRDADRIYIYGESRYGFDNLVWYGLQGIIKLHLTETITVESVEQMQQVGASLVEALVGVDAFDAYLDML